MPASVSSPVPSERVFSLADQKRFATLSGDANPMHVDPVYARRLMYGRAVVHGIHLLLWSLDEVCAEIAAPIELTKLSCRFASPVAVDETAALTIERNDDHLVCRIDTPQGNAALVEARFAQAANRPLLGYDAQPPPPDAPQLVSRDAIATAAGTLDLHLAEELFAQLFPHASRCFPLAQAAVLLATTRLVGVHCPGLNSIYSELELDFGQADESEARPILGYRVERFDARMSLVRILVEAPAARGLVKAFVRPSPIAQPTASELQRHVDASEFSGRRALIVGGSRGLGALTAKLLAAGGASVMLTYFQGESEARSVTDEIVQIGGAASAIRFDASHAPEPQLGSLRIDGEPISHLYYFATAPIFVARRGRFNPDLFRRFCTVYVEGFAQLVQALIPRGLRVAFYPSSTAISEVPIEMGEYAAAKAAGEHACRFLEKANPGLAVLVARLPRLPTDQTRSLLPARDEDPVVHLLRELRRA